MKHRILFLAAVMALAGTAAALRATAQRPMSRDTIRGAVVEVHQTYTPEIRLAPKAPLAPVLPPVDTVRQPQTYEVPQQALHYTYRSLPLRPLALGRDTTLLPPQSFVRVGGGSRSTAFLEAGVSGVKGLPFTGSIYGRHLSQKGPLRFQAASASEFHAQAEGTAIENHTIKASLRALHNRFGYYGYDAARLPSDVELPRIRYTGVRGSLSLQSDSITALGFRYGASGSTSSYTNHNGTGEQTGVLSANGAYSLDDGLEFSVEIMGTGTRLRRFDGGSEGNNIFAVRPALHYNRGDFKSRAGLYPTWGRGGIFYVLPDVLLAYRVPRSPLHFSAGWEATLWQNTYEQLSIRNPFVGVDFPVRQTRSDDVYGKISTAAGQHFSFSAKGGWRQWRGLPLFVNRYDNTAFQVVHDGRVDAIQVEASARYAIGENFSVGASTVFTSFYRKTYDRVWHEPGVRLGADLAARPLRGLSVGAAFSVLDRIAAPDRDGRAVWLKPVVDLGLHGEYDLTDRFAAFARIDNLLNYRYERWRGYPAFGIAVWGGLRYRF